MKKGSPYPILATATFNDMNSLCEFENVRNKFLILNLREKERNSILTSDHLLADESEPFINPWGELSFAKERYEHKVFHTFKFLLDSSNQLVIKSDINPKSIFFRTPFVGVIFDEDSSIHFIPFRCFCAIKKSIVRNMYLISDNALSVFGRYYTNEQIYLSFQKMKYQKFVLDCHLKKNDRFKTGIYYLQIYKYY